MDAAVAASILAMFRSEWQRLIEQERAAGRRIHASKWAGCRQRYRGRLVREAGLSPDDAYFAIRDAVEGIAQTPPTKDANQ